MKHLILAVVIAFGTTACSSPSSRLQCHSWRTDGDFFVTTNSCIQCVQQLGPNKDAVRGCAMGLDAASLLTPRTN